MDGWMDERKRKKKRNVPCTSDISRLGIVCIIPCPTAEFEPTFGVDGHFNVPRSPAVIVFFAQILTARREEKGEKRLAW